jgi:hypothetical protein
LEQVHVFCRYDAEQFQLLVTTHDDGISYTLKPMCGEMQDVPDLCIDRQPCADPPGTWMYLVYRSSPGSPNVPWGTVCLDGHTAANFDVITPGRVFSAMKQLSWPAADLVIEPPGGRTLVNLPTNFLTTSTTPVSKTLTLWGHQLVIRATPVGYLWHFGDGETHEGADPGAAYPDLRITHSYRHAGVRVAPSVDVTYHGSYRVDDGPWQDIPDTLTVPGTPVNLQVLSATPHLVG